MREHQDHSTHRRSFLGRLIGGGAALALGGLGARRADAAPLAAAGSRSASWDERWLDRITGKHRQVFDAVSVGDGIVLAFAVNFLDTNKEAYSLTDKDLTAVIVARHAAIPMVFSDAIWAKYKLGEMLSITDPRTKAPAVRNIFIDRRPDEMLLPGMAVDLLQQRGVIFTCCNVALTFMSGHAAAGAGVSPEAAKDDWTRGLLDGVTIVPSGVLAVNRAQEKECTYCYAG
ncbi:MAG TPA: hypothetical protein VFK13_10415 [Gemmatimonadaceae bacterium]|nr:hypothetical protein [Gemmatimonadaceae bacterium]